MFNLQGRRKGNFQRGARSANFQIFFSNMALNKSISDLGGGAGLPGWGASVLIYKYTVYIHVHIKHIYHVYL